MKEYEVGKLTEFIEVCNKIKSNDELATFYKKLKNYIKKEDQMAFCMSTDDYDLPLPVTSLESKKTHIQDTLNQLVEDIGQKKIFDKYKK
jgi:hypothetical protein